MIKNNKKALLFTTALLSLSLFLGTGCTNRNAQQNPPANNTDTAKEKVQESKGQVNETSQNLTNRAQKIADEVTKIDGIDKARVAISEKRALVGVTIPNNAEGKLTDDLKKKVEDTVKNTDKEIDTVAVSADADIYERISKIGDGIKDGRGIEEFGNEFKELFNRIIPQ
ncbi:YhcN/YlaJ family sporulation lipoprotein [Clostridium caseinilyticum]|uniref:YhcN/YlaJ family sporulation lipoprotein n=1 Tax=Clostridium caseinilyticum TaxID=3350403 RepID=UPI0038F6F935